MDVERGSWIPESQTEMVWSSGHETDRDQHTQRHGSIAPITS
jgi:hypothetical protein